MRNVTMLHEQTALRIAAGAMLLGGLFEAGDGMRPLWIPLSQAAFGAVVFIGVRSMKHREKRNM